MLLFKVVLFFYTHWIVSGDLLDLYVEHMDETMKTLEYKTSHSKDLRSRSRNKRSAIEGPFFRIGNYRRQRLDVDENWSRIRKAKGKNQVKPLKGDGLEFPNKQEMNPAQDQHEFFNNIENEPKRRISMINGRDEVAVFQTEEILLKDKFTAKPFSDREPEELDEQTQFELSGLYPNEKEVPPLKKNPKLWNRVPKKYLPISKDLKVDFKGGKKDERRVVEESVRERRSLIAENSVKDVVFSRIEILDNDGDVVLEWDPSDEEVITFKVTAKTLGYVGIGFNEKSHMKGADLILAWVDDHTRQVNLLDSHGLKEANTAPVTDVSQDVTVISGDQNNTHTTIIFSRKWQTCDPDDKHLTGDTIKVLWALHPTDPELNSAAFHGEKRGGRALRLKAHAPHPPPPPKTADIQHWDVKLNQFAVSNSTDTEYWCKIFKAPMAEKHHMIGYTPLVEKSNEGLVHHVILYECVSTSPTLGKHTKLAGAHCYSPTMPREWESCLQPVLAWARGSKGEWFPEHVGIPLGEHKEGTYYMLEVHYNNPLRRTIIDSSGVRIHYTSNFRINEAGILVAGVAVTPLHVVPPKQETYATAGYCTPDCTNMMFPDEGINVVSVVLHSHLAGRKLSLKHIREGTELPTIVQDNHFDFDYQQSHTLDKEIKILPGDEIVAECVYGTLNRPNATLGGYAADQEMCLAFVVHYPRTELAACYSMTPVRDLFKTLGITSFKGISMEHLEKLFLTTGFDALALPSMQLSTYQALQADDQSDEDLVKKTESALKIMRDYTEAKNNDMLFTTLVIEDPPEFRGRTLAEHMQALPWTEELLVRSIEKSLYHGKHMTFCRMRNDNLAMPVVIQMFPNFTALPEPNNTICTEMKRLTSSTEIPSPFSFLLIMTLSVPLLWTLV